MRPLAALTLAAALGGCSSAPTGTDAALDRHLPTADRGDLAARGDSVGRDAVKTDRTAPLEAASGDLPPGVDPCFPEPAAGQLTVTCDGLSFEVSVPPACLAPSKPCGLIVDVHGLSMTGKMEEANTGLAALGLKHGYLVVQPNAPGNPPLSSWSVF